jgi:ABC-type transport system substrate-binding protein
VATGEEGGYVVQGGTNGSPGTAHRLWTRRGFLVTWSGAGLGIALLTACGPATAPPSNSTAAPLPTQAAPLATAAPPKPAAQAAAVTPKDGGTLHLMASNWTADPPSLDPYLNVSYLVQTFAGFFYSRLLMSKKGPDVPALAYMMEGDLAESWKASEDGKTWTFTLRSNATWQDVPPMNGRPVTAQDVAWSFDHFMQTSPQKSSFNQVASVSALDARTVQFTLKDVFAPFESLIGSPLFWILPKDVVEQDGDATRRIVGSGPFIFDRLDTAVAYSGHKNPKYYRAAEPHVDGFVAHLIPDLATQVAALRAHELDLFINLPVQQQPPLKQSNPELQYLDWPWNTYPFVYWKVDTPPFNDPRVRQAVSMSINRDNILKVLYNGRGNWNTAIPWAFSEWWLDPRSADQGPTAKFFKYDPAAARQLLAAAGHPEGLNITLLSTPGYGDTWVQQVELVQQDLKSGGIDATIQMQEYGSYIATTFAGKFEGGNVLVYGPETTFNEPNDYLFNMYHPSGTRNHSSVNDPKLTAMIEQQVRTLDRAERKKQLADIQRYLAEQMYYVPGVAYYYLAGLTPAVHDFYPVSDYGVGAEVVPKLWLDRG